MSLKIELTLSIMTGGNDSLAYEEANLEIEESYLDAGELSKLVAVLASRAVKRSAKKVAEPEEDDPFGSFEGTPDPY